MYSIAENRYLFFYQMIYGSKSLLHEVDQYISSYKIFEFMRIFFKFLGSLHVLKVVLDLLPILKNVYNFFEIFSVT